ncbi:MAG: DUF5723 family protein [Chitinophagales bacterium]
MKRNALYAVLLGVCLLCAKYAETQEFSGIRMDNFSGSNGMLFNPASPVSGSIPWDVNVLAAGISEDNNYISIPRPFITYLHTSDSILDVDYFHPEKVYAHEQVLLQLPSAFFTFNDFAAGFFTTARSAGYFLGDQVDGGTTGLKDIPFYAPTVMPAFNAGTMLWTEIGFNLEATLERNSVYAFHVGANVKYLTGFEALGFENIDPFLFTKDTVNTSISAFNTHFDYTRNLGSNRLYDPSNYSINGHGIGMDLGAVFTIHRPSKFKYSKNQDYYWKFGASLLDLGVLKFKNNAGSYHLEQDESFSVANIVLDSIDDIDEFNRTGSRILYDFSDASQDGNRFSMYLPAALALTADRWITGDLYAQAVIVRRIPHVGTNLIARANMFALIPRYETRMYGFSLPLTLYEDREFKFGASARWMFFTIGSDNLLTFIDQHDYSSIDLYCSIRITPYWLVPKVERRGIDCFRWKKNKQ